MAPLIAAQNGHHKVAQLLQDRSQDTVGQGHGHELPVQALMEILTIEMDLLRVRLQD